MIGSSSTWYAISARFRSARSSAARAAMVVVLEDAKELLGRIDDRVRLLGLEPLAFVDPSPCHGHREHPGRLRGADVERRVAHVRRRARIGPEPLGGEQ